MLCMCALAGDQLARGEGARTHPAGKRHEALQISKYRAPIDEASSILCCLRPPGHLLMGRSTPSRIGGLSILSVLKYSHNTADMSQRASCCLQVATQGILADIKAPWAPFGNCEDPDAQALCRSMQQYSGMLSGLSLA